MPIKTDDKNRKARTPQFCEHLSGHFKQTRYKHVLNERQIDIGVKQLKMTATAVAAAAATTTTMFQQNDVVKALV